jgi:predicted  nucleic acid-binding Zn-ribbon protein
MEQIRIAVLTPYDKVLAFLDNTVPSAMHYFDETLHTYLKGSAYTFEFTTLTAHDDAAFLVEGNKLSFTRKNKGYYLTIMNVEKGGNTTNVTAYGLCLELTNEYVDAYKAPRAMSFAEYVNAYGFEQSFVIGKNEVSDKRITHEWTGSDTVLARLYSIANVFDAELEFVTQLNDDYSLKNFVLNIYRAHSDSVQGMGSDKRSTILRYPNDVYGITKTSDITELYTGIRPTGNNGLQLNSISGRVVKDSNGNILYKVQGNNILAPQSRDRFPSTLLTNHSNDMYAVLVWSYETENVETLYGQALAQLKKNCVPKVTYDVDAYIDAEIGDTFTIEDAEYSPTLYLEARITEQEICFTDTEKCKTIFDNFEEKQSQISSALISEMNKMIELKKIYEGSIVSTNGVLFKTDSDSTKLTALVKDDGVDITSKYSIIWYKDDEQLSTSQTIIVNASDFTEKAVYRFKAMSGEILKASAEVTVMRLQDGQNGTSAYVHIAYANSSDGRVDFSLTDSNRKFIGQYSDSKQYGSDDPTKYRWSAIKGEDGQSFVSAEEQFYYSTSQTELIGGEWFVGNVVYQSDKFLWKRWKCTYANPSEIKYTKAIFDNTWNEIDAKIGEIHTQVSQANVQSKEALGKAEDAEKLATSANGLASTANKQSEDAVKLAQDANTSTGKAQQQIDAIKGDITDSKQQIQDAVDKANTNASEIDTVKETYATKVDLTTESKSIHADVTTEIEKKVGELSTTVSETYASKSDLTSIEGSLNTKIKQNADSITTQASSIEKLQSDTTQAKKDITDATKKATDAQTQADKALGNAQSAQTLADQAKKKADSAQTNLDNANKELADAKANLETVTGRVDATESEITKAQTRLTNAESAVQKAQSDATKAQGNATTAINNAKAAQGAADDAKQKAEQAQKELAELTNKVTSNTTKIEQNANAIKLQATSVTKIKGVADNANSKASSALNKANSLTDRANSGEFDGRGVASTTVEYQASTSGTTVPTGTWSTTIPSVAQGSYLWTKTTTNYTSGNPTVGYSVARMGVNGAKGEKGEIGQTGPQGPQGLKGETGTQGPQGIKGDTGERGPQGIQGPQGVQGATGPQGVKGNDGKGIKSTSVTYQIWSNGTSTPTGTWSSTPPKTTADKPYLWTRTVITYSDNTQSTSYSVGSTPEGIQVGGRNLLKNSHSVEQTYSYPSSNYVDQCNWVTSIPLNGDTYTLSFWAKSTVAGDVIRVHFYSPSNITHCVGSQGQVSGNSDGQCDFTLSTVLTKYWVTYTIPKGGNSARSVIIPRMFSDFGKGTVSVKWEKLEEGNKATDWTPAPEDVDEAINTERTTRQSAIEAKANEITSKVSETYVSNSAFEHYQNTVSSQFTQTKNEFKWEINQNVSDAKNELNGQINSVNGRLDGLKQTTDNVNSYMSFDNDALTLGKSDSAFKTKITNQEWSIQKNGAKVTYINDQTMYITDGQFTQSLKVGSFGFVPRANGSLDFKKVG